MLPSRREVTEYENVTLKQKDLVTAPKLFKSRPDKDRGDERESLKGHVIKKKMTVETLPCSVALNVGVTVAQV